MSTTRTNAPSVFTITKVMQLVAEHLAQLNPASPDEQENEELETDTLFEELKEAGADIGKIMEQLLLAANEAKSDAEAIKAYRDKMKLRQERRERRNEVLRHIALAVMSQFPELFPPGPKSKALAAFRGGLVDARVQRAQDGIIITDPDKLMQQDRFVLRSLNTQAVKSAMLEDGEVLEGAERKNGGSFLVIRAT